MMVRNLIMVLKIWSKWRGTGAGAVGYLIHISPYASEFSGSANVGRVVTSGGLSKWKQIILLKQHQPYNPRLVLLVVGILTLGT